MSYTTPSDHTLEMYNFDSQRRKSEIVVIGERAFPLNKSRCKYVSVGMTPEYNYDPCIRIMGNKGDLIMFSEYDWMDFLTYQGVITNYLYTNDAADPIQFGNFKISFEQISSSRIIKIWKNEAYVYLGYETVCKLWELLPLIKYRIEMLKKLQFVNYFNLFKKSVQYQCGNIFVNASRILDSGENCPTENVCLVLEFMNLYPDAFEDEFSCRV